ncbi:hypothetical protein YUYDRAFT_02095 [Streptomyces sp. ScaeMP-e48]|uniref:hypothetical protein n=1 Tax=Streptomyces sp. ScaeMP-e48 TaxID=1100823 RepID=UPI000823F845|nr:hypothetical protein [Streptomyces sp. ScaeMP-e48]SCK20179.1 hypothetical protein YUYDRAFT_02095 [Streptomyces sp. ScaeMP-e48]
MDATLRVDLNRDQLAAWETALEAQAEAAQEQQHLVHPTLPPVPCPACSAAVEQTCMSWYEDGVLFIDAAPCGHLFRSRVEFTRDPGFGLP